MRTAIYVYSGTRLSITTSEPGLRLFKYPDDRKPVRMLTSPVDGVDVDPGVYKVVSTKHVAITDDHEGANLQIVVSPNNKSQFPQPPPVPAIAEAADLRPLQAFFASDADGNVSRSIG